MRFPNTAIGTSCSIRTHNRQVQLRPRAAQDCQTWLPR